MGIYELICTYRFKTLSDNRQSWSLVLSFVVLEIAIMATYFALMMSLSHKHQYMDIGVGSVTTELYGTTIDSKGDTSWDATDVQVPARETDSFFIVTNYEKQIGQTQGKCAEESGILSANCSSDLDCPQNKTMVPYWHGVPTGKCLPGASGGLCEVHAWCPVIKYSLPEDKKRRHLLFGTKNFRVVIKNNVYFPKFEHSFNNIYDDTSEICRNGPNDPYCPIFNIGYIVEQATKKSPVSFDDFIVKGGLVSIRIKWECDFDFNREKDCKPEYEFDRLDKDGFGADGYATRFSHKYRENGVLKRDLTVANGIHFKIQVEAKGYGFDTGKFFILLATGFTYLNLGILFINMCISIQDSRNGDNKSLSGGNSNNNVAETPQ